MMLLRHLLQPFLLEPLPVAFAENLVTFNGIRVSRARAANSSCPICQINPYAGYGDCAPGLGMDSAAVTGLPGTPLESEPECS